MKKFSVLAVATAVMLTLNACSGGGGGKKLRT